MQQHTAHRAESRHDPAIRGLVFDKDGTLFDFARTWGTWCGGFIRELAGADAANARALAAQFHYDLDSGSFARTSPVIAGTMDVVITAIRLVFPERDPAEIRRQVQRSTAAVRQVEAVPLAPLLDGLRARGHVLGLATNDSEGPARAHLAASGILDRFSFVAGYDSGHGAKPGPGMLHAFCRATGLAAGACVMIGDSTHDLASGRAAGMRTIGVLTGPARSEDLAALADVILPDIGHLPGWLASACGRSAVGASRPTDYHSSITVSADQPVSGASDHVP